LADVILITEVICQLAEGENNFSELKDAHGKTRTAYKILTGKPGAQRLLSKETNIGDNIKTDIYVFIYSLFNDVFSNMDYIPSNERMIIVE
jgi:hypothetical protein